MLSESQSSVESGRRKASRSRASTTERLGLAERLGGAVRDAEEEWDFIMVKLQRTNADKRPRVASEMNMPYVHSQVLSAMRKEDLKVEEKWKGKEAHETASRYINRSLEEFSGILDRVNADYEENGCWGGQDIKSLATIIDDEGLDLCRGVLTESGTKGRSANPLSLGAIEIEMAEKRAIKKHIIEASRFR